MKRVATLLLLVACRRDVTAAESTSAASALPSSPPPALASTTSPVSAPYGPLITADGAQREHAVLDLIVGGDAGALPERSTDPGKSFEPKLRDRIAPTTTSASSVRQNRLVVSDPTSLPPEVITRRLRQQYARLRVCHQRGMLTHPGLEGDVTVSFRIAADGTVADAKNDASTLAHPETVSCMVHAIDAVLFPKPSRDVSVTYGVHVAPPP